MSAKYYKSQSTDGPNFIKVEGEDTYLFIVGPDLLIFQKANKDTFLFDKSDWIEVSKESIESDIKILVDTVSAL